ASLQGARGRLEPDGSPVDGSGSRGGSLRRATHTREPGGSIVGMTVFDGVQWLERYSVFILPALAVFEQVGIPLPAVPALLVTGALAAAGRVNLWLILGPR